MLNFPMDTFKWSVSITNWMTDMCSLHSLLVVPRPSLIAYGWRSSGSHLTSLSGKSQKYLFCSRHNVRFLEVIREVNFCTCLKMPPCPSKPLSIHYPYHYYCCTLDICWWNLKILKQEVRISRILDKNVCCQAPKSNYQLRLFREAQGWIDTLF